jgi:hypothetical protein
MEDDKPDQCVSNIPAGPLLTSARFLSVPPSRSLVNVGDEPKESLTTKLTMGHAALYTPVGPILNSATKSTLLPRLTLPLN